MDSSVLKPFNKGITAKSVSFTTGNGNIVEISKEKIATVVEKLWGKDEQNLEQSCKMQQYDVKKTSQWDENPNLGKTNEVDDLCDDWDSIDDQIFINAANSAEQHDNSLNNKRLIDEGDSIKETKKIKYEREA